MSRMEDWRNKMFRLVSLQPQSRLAILGVLIISIRACGIFAARWRRRNRLKPVPPPSPRGHWLFGHLPQLPEPVHGDHMDIQFLAWLKECGGTYMLNLPPFIPRFIVVGDPELARHVVSTRNFRKSWTYLAVAPIIGTKSLILLEGEKWSVKRRALNPGFSPDALKGMVSVIDRKVASLISRCRQAEECGDSLHMHDAAHTFAMDVITQFAIGVDWESKDALLQRTIQSMKDLIEECTLLLTGYGWWNPLRWARVLWLDNVLSRGLARIVNQRLDRLRHAASMRQQQPRHGQGQEPQKQQEQREEIQLDILNHAIAAATHREGKSAGGLRIEPSAMVDIVSQLRSFFFAGHDTTASVLAWAVWLLAQHPEKSDRIRAEVRLNLPDWDKAFPPNPTTATPPTDPAGDAQPPDPAALGGVSASGLNQCEFLDAVVKETLRLYPPAATARYTTDADEEFEGVGIGGAVLLVSAYVLHRSPALWSDPDAFAPERWLQPAAKSPAPGADSSASPALHASEDCLGDPGGGSASSCSGARAPHPHSDAGTARNSWAYQPFSRGPRDCIGKHLATLELKMAVAALVCQFSFEAVDPADTVQYRITSRPMRGCRVRVQSLAAP